MEMKIIDIKLHQYPVERADLSHLGRLGPAKDIPVGSSGMVTHNNDGRYFVSAPGIDCMSAFRRYQDFHAGKWQQLDIWAEAIVGYETPDGGMRTETFISEGREVDSDRTLCLHEAGNAEMIALHLHLQAFGVTEAGLTRRMFGVVKEALS